MLSNLFILLILLSSYVVPIVAQDSYYPPTTNSIVASITIDDGLEEIYDGTEQPHIRWLDLGNHQELHVIQVDNLQLNIPKGVHLALTTADLDSFITYLNALEVDYYDWPGKIAAKSVRPDGIEQVYIQDLDGYWIEINNGEKRHNH